MSATTAQRTIETDIPSRLDRLPWSSFHWRIVIGLGTVWVLDGLQVTVVGAISPRMTEAGSGIDISTAQIGLAGALYVAGACVGALLFGHLTDRFGRKRLFMVTLGLYIAASVATAFSPAAWFFLLFRTLTGLGIGGEYSAINTAIDELIPARNRGRVDIAINGSFWVGAALGGLGSLLFLDQSLFAADVGWRLAFAIGAVLGLGILLVRRNVPESPRWLFIHGREEEAERIVAEIEAEVLTSAGRDRPEPSERIVVRQRDVIPFREVGRYVIGHYPRRAVLGLALFLGQAFLYNAVTFDLGTILSRFFGVGSGAVPLFLLLFALGNFLGPLLLGRLFDTVGRIPMIAGTYLASAVVVVVLGILLRDGALTRWSFEALVVGAFFFASAGASSAYLTVSEIFPMETRALAIALFYAVGTAVGGISGPLLFGQFIHSGSATQVATGFFIGAGAMALGGVAELLLGVPAEGRSLESIARPLTAAEVTTDGRGPAPDRADEARDARVERRHTRERDGLRRLRPGVGGTFYSPAMAGTAGATSRFSAVSDIALDREVEALAAVLAERGPIATDELERLVRARAWGPGRYRAALREVVADGRGTQVSHGVYRARGDGRGAAYRPPAARP